MSALAYITTIIKQGRLFVNTNIHIKLIDNNGISYGIIIQVIHNLSIYDASIYGASTHDA